MRETAATLTVVHSTVAGTDDAAPVFFYELTSPRCYIAAERVLSLLPIVPEWEPVLGAEIGAEEPAIDRSTVESQARALGLQPVRWPANLQVSREAALAATYAKQIGRTVSFSLACFRQIFAAGRDPAELDTILLAGAASEMHPSALIKAITLRSVASGLEQAQQRARTAGVRALPAITAAGRVFSGEDAVERASRALGGPR